MRRKRPEVYTQIEVRADAAGRLYEVRGDPRCLTPVLGPPDARAAIGEALSGIADEWAAVDWTFRERTPAERASDPWSAFDPPLIRPRYEGVHDGWFVFTLPPNA